MDTINNFNQHQISELLKISLSSIKEITDVNMVIGDPIKLHDAEVIPISRVKYTFLSGGLDQKLPKSYVNGDYPFGGGAGGTANIMPVAFLVYHKDEIKVLPMEETPFLIDTIQNFIPETINKILNIYETYKTKHDK